MKRKYKNKKQFSDEFKQSIIQMNLMRLGILPEKSWEDSKKGLHEDKLTVDNFDLKDFIESNKSKIETITPKITTAEGFDRL